MSLLRYSGATQRGEHLFAEETGGESLGGSESKEVYAVSSSGGGQSALKSVLFGSLSL